MIAAGIGLSRQSRNCRIESIDGVDHLPSELLKHADFLTVSITHGAAQLALYDQALWDKYQLTRLAGEQFKANSLIVEPKLRPPIPRIMRTRGGLSPARMIRFRR
jgi:hypothetical protein